jgi:hypothetical protein
MTDLPGNTRRRWRKLALPALALLLGLAGAMYLLAGKVRLGAEAYVFGYPLVITDVTRESAAVSVGPPNRLIRVRQFPPVGFRAVVRPNYDTLYTTAFIAMSRGPWVFEMPPNSERYEVMPFMDAWTNVFATPGTRSTGTRGGRYLLAGPAWHGPVPDGMTLLRSPTDIVWLIGRTQTNGSADYPTVHRLQDGLHLRSLQDWQNGIAETASTWQAPATVPTPPVQQMKAMSSDEFFTRLTRLMQANPPVAADAPMVERMVAMGLRPGQAPDWGWLDSRCAALGRWLADRLIARELARPRDLVRGWATPPAILGNYGTDYKVRTAVAMVGLGANLPADALYPNTALDDKGDALVGSRRYRLHFEAARLPPVQAFWSLTVYGLDDFVQDNPLHRYALGDRDKLAFNADGSLDIWLQSDAPDAARQSNWLPVQKDAGFLLNARLYWPRAAALDGSWRMPAVERID